MTRTEIKNILLNSLDNAKEASGGKQVICRCHLPGCNDTKQHLYIGRFDSSDEPLFYNCFKCHQSGIINKNFFDMYDWNSIDNDIIDNISQSNKGNSYRTYKNGNLSVYNIKNNMITPSQLSDHKLKYINDRLGTSLTFQDCLNLKIVLNLADLLTCNNITYFTRAVDIIRQLNINFIGFLSRTNGSLNMRNLVEGTGKIDESIDKKYINYNVFNSTMKDDYYIIPTQLDLNQHIKVYIAEGAFDILSVYLNLVLDHTNSIFIAGKGKAYLDIIEYLITTYGIYNFELHYYVDRDVSDISINSICNYLSAFEIDFYIHRNQYNNEKDYGVPKERIIDTVRKI